MFRKTSILVLLFLAASTAVLGMLSTSTAVLGMLSLSRPIGWQFGPWPQPSSYAVFINNGDVTFNHARRLRSSAADDAIGSVHFLRASGEIRWGKQIGVHMHDAFGHAVDARLLLLVEGRIPLWMLFVLLAAYPAFVWNQKITRWVILLSAVALAGLEAVRLIVLLPELRIGREWAIGVHLFRMGSRDTGSFDFVARGWAVPALLAFVPLLVFVRGPLRRCLRCRRGLCENCAYDLTGLTEARCPECGTPFGLRLIENAHKRERYGGQ